MLTLHLQENDPIALNGEFGKRPNFDEAYFVQTSSKYVQQLMLAKDWRSAHIVALMIPSRFTAIRSKLVYEVMNLTAGQSLVSQKKDEDFITQQLSLPLEWMLIARALSLQNLNLNE